MVIQVKNDLSINAPKTYLSFTEAAGTNVLRWKNPNGFAASWAIQIGETGAEQTEVVMLGASTPAGTAGTLTANTLYEHPADTPIYGIKWNQVVFEVSTTGTAGTAAPITDGTITIQADRDVTQFDHTAGLSTYGYRTMFRNSVLTVNSTESDWITSAGLSFYSLGKIRQRAKDKLFSAGYIKSDDIIDDWIREWQDEMTNAAIKVNEDYALGTANVAFGTSGYGTVTTADFKKPVRVWVAYNGTDKYKSTKMGINDYGPNQTFNYTHPYHAFLGDNVLQVKPADNGGTAEIIFSRWGTHLSNDTDELPLPMRGYTKSFVDYCVAQAMFKDEKDPAYQEKMAECISAKRDFAQELSPRDVSGPTMIELVDSVPDMGEELDGWL